MNNLEGKLKKSLWNLAWGPRQTTETGLAFVWVEIQTRDLVYTKQAFQPFNHDDRCCYRNIKNAAESTVRFIPRSKVTNIEAKDSMSMFGTSVCLPWQLVSEDGVISRWALNTASSCLPARERELHPSLQMFRHCLIWQCFWPTSMEKNASWEVNICWVCQEVNQVLWNQEVHCLLTRIFH